MKAHALAKYLMKCPDVVVRISTCRNHEYNDVEVECAVEYEVSDGSELYLTYFDDKWETEEEGTLIETPELKRYITKRIKEETKLLRQKIAELNKHLPK